MKLASWNINGLRSVMKKGELVKFLADQQPDILCLQEVKIKPDQVDFELPGYQLILNSAERPGYSGTGLVIKDQLVDKLDLSSIINNLPSDIAGQFDIADDYGDPNSEGRVMVINLGDYYLATVYTPNAKPDLSRLALRHDKWDPTFLAYMDQLRQTKPVVFCGDLNVAAEEIDLANPKSNRGRAGFTDGEREGFRNYRNDKLLDSFRFIHGDIPNQYTWWSHWAKSRERNVGWRIDYFMVDEQLQSRIKDAAIYPNQMGSDHCPISVTIE